MQIALKPHGQRDGDLAAITQRLQDALGAQQGLRVYMQPVQDLTIDDRVSRTQYQMTLSNPDIAVLAEWAPKLVDRLSQLPELPDVAHDPQNACRQPWVDTNPRAPQP